MNRAIMFPTTNGNVAEKRFLLERQNYSHYPSERRPSDLRVLLRIAFLLVITGVGICIFIFTDVPDSWGNIEELTPSDLPDSIPRCREEPCFHPAKVRVATDKSSFPTFWKYGHRGPIHVTYDNRAIKINGERSFFLGGSMHPSRATKQTWKFALDEAVRNGLNLITIYIMWSAHQPMPHKDLNWGFDGSYNVECDPMSKSCGWDLASAIRLAADRGLFVHIRLGPYDCAEYNYGGIPEWLSLHKPKMEMRRPNREWINVMEHFVKKTIDYISDHKLWAHQGGNIILAQIENELGEDGAIEDAKNLLLVDENGLFVDPNGSIASNRKLRNATLQDYADWCGALAQRLAPNVTWTMCNGLSAKNTILTCNAISEGHTWLESHGGNGRIQVDQPALFTEFEGGFQTWGSNASKPLDYFWGRSARDMTKDAMKWFARGGSHLNYYMFWGGYNRQRTAAAGITNRYASEVALCPSGERHQPKFGHFENLHEAIVAVAPTLLRADSSLGKGQPIKYLSGDGSWKEGTDQRAFEYKVEGETYQHVLFLENDADEDVAVQLPKTSDESSPMIVMMNADSSILFVDGMVEFDSSSIDPQLMSFERKYSASKSLPMLLNWTLWQEPIGADIGDPITWTGNSPAEQTELNTDSGVNSDYVWYETSFRVEHASKDACLFIETQKATAFLAYIDSNFIGATDDHLHKEGPTTLSIAIGSLNVGLHKLQILAESLGYHNLIGRWGGSTRSKTKGITGDVKLLLGSKNISLVDGRVWRSYPGLHGEALNRGEMKRSNFEGHLPSALSQRPTWSSTLFDSPKYDPALQSFFVKVTSGRGHIWLNGNDLGKFWNITREQSTKYSQDYYFLPADFLHTNGQLNELIIFNAFGDPRGSVQLVLSWLAASNYPNLQDEVDFLDACI